MCTFIKKTRAVWPLLLLLFAACELGPADVPPSFGDCINDCPCAQTGIARVSPPQ